MPKGRIAEEEGEQSTRSEKQARWEEVLRGERLTQVAAIAQYPDKLNEPRVRRIPRQLALSPPQEGVGPKGAGRAWARDVWTYKISDVEAAVASLEPIQRRPRTHKPWNRKRPPSCFPAYYPKRGKTDDDDSADDDASSSDNDDEKDDAPAPAPAPAHPHCPVCEKPVAKPSKLLACHGSCHAIHDTCLREYSAFKHKSVLMCPLCRTTEPRSDALSLLAAMAA